MPLDLTGPFRGSAARAAGLLTPAMLRGPRYRRLFPDVYVPADLDDDLAVRARAAGLLVAGRGVVAGWAAAELLGASCAPPGAPVDVLLTGDRAQGYRCPGVRVHRDRTARDEIGRVGPTAVTTPARTAYDLARWGAVADRAGGTGSIWPSRSGRSRSSTTGRTTARRGARGGTWFGRRR